MQTAIAQHLHVAETAILKIEEWANVLFVVVRGLGGRFVSKKIAMKEKISAYELADKIADEINDSESIYTAKLWNKKAGETRVYVSYPHKKGPKDCGFIQVMDSGEINRHLTLQAGTIAAIYAPLVERYEVAASLSANDSLSVAAAKIIVEECWECGATYTTYGNVESGNMSCRRCR